MRQASPLSKAIRVRSSRTRPCCGRGDAVANIFGVHLSGLLAWLMWLFIHLIYIVEFQSRIIVFIQWGFEYLTFSRGARLITGEAATVSTGQIGPNGNGGDGR